MTSLYRLERKKGRLVDRFSDELFREKCGKKIDAGSLSLSPPSSARPPPPFRPATGSERPSALLLLRGGTIALMGFSAAAIDNEEER